MELLVSIIAGLIAALFVLKNKADRAEAKSKLAETAGRDKELAEDQLDVHKAISEIDENIKRMKEERNSSKKEKTLEETAEDIKKGLK